MVSGTANLGIANVMEAPRLAEELTSTIELAEATTPEEFSDDCEAVGGTVFKGDGLENPIRALPDRVQADPSALEVLKQKVIETARPRIDIDAVRFARWAKNEEGLRAHGFKSLDHFVRLVTQGRETGAISITPAERMITSLKTMFAEEDFTRLIDAVTRPTEEEKSEARRTILCSTQMVGFYGIMAMEAMLWGATGASALMHGLTDTGTLMIGAAALISVPVAFVRAVRKAIRDWNTALSYAGRPERLKSFLIPRELREWSDNV
ncbi:MAG: hypothetical protein WC600_17755 [Desulfobaccales bacterium]